MIYYQGNDLLPRVGNELICYSHIARYVCVSAVLKDMQKSKILDGRSYIVYLNTMTKTNAFLNIQIFLLKFEHSQKHSFLEHCLCCGYVIILNNLNSINKIPTHWSNRDIKWIAFFKSHHLHEGLSQKKTNSK